MATGPTADRLEASSLDRFAERWWQAKSSGEAARVLALCAQEVEWDDPQLREPVGRAGVAAELLDWWYRAFPNSAYEADGPLYMASDGRSAIGAWRLSATHSGPLEPPGYPPSGRSLHLNGIDRWELHDGLVLRCHTVYDGLSMARQLGNIPSPGHRIERVSAFSRRLRKRLRR